MTSSWLLHTGRNKVAGNSQFQKNALEKNKVSDHFKIEEGAIKKNGVIRYFEKKEKIKAINKNMFKISFFK